MTEISFVHIRLLIGTAILFSIISSCFGIGAAVNVIAPATIYDPGVYHLLNDVTNCSTDCIVIAGSDIILEGDGHSISGTGYVPPSNSNPGGADPRPLAKGIRIEALGGASQVNNVVIRNISVDKFGLGVYANHLTGGKIERCSFSNGFIGTIFDYTTELTIKDTLYTDNYEVGIDSEGWSHDCIFDNNLIQRNGIGVSLHETSGYQRVTNNTIINNSYGICTWFPGEDLKSWRNTIANNRIVGNGVGIDGAKEYAIVNNILNNTRNIDHITVGNRWNTTPTAGVNIVRGLTLGGNYWAYPNGTGFSQVVADNDHDGFADAANIIAAQNTDHYPLHLINPSAIHGESRIPLDLNDDGLYEDVNGNGRRDFADVVLYFNQMTWISANEPLIMFDYNGNGRIDFADVTWLFNNL